jgi:dephospho-CoA kinase
MKIIAITGSIGCGKTYISDMIKSLGYIVFDADKEVRNFYKNKKFLNIIKQNFPNVFKNEVFNKKDLREHVFNNKDELKKLENIIHPLLKQKLKEKVRKNCKNTDFIFIDAALIFEMNWDKYCDYIILADVDKEIQKRRVMIRDNITEKDFEKIIKNQTDNEIKKQKSDFIINTELPDGIVKILLIKFIKEVLNA